MIVVVGCCCIRLLRRGDGLSHLSQIAAIIDNWCQEAESEDGKVKERKNGTSLVDITARMDRGLGADSSSQISIAQASDGAAASRSATTKRSSHK